MAVYTPVSFSHLSHFLMSYDVGELQAIEPIETGIENSNFHVTTSKMRLILTLYENESLYPHLPFYLRTLCQLSENHIPCPQVIKPQGQDHGLGQIHQKPAAFFSFLQGQSCFSPRPHECEQIGSILAQIHLTGQDITAPANDRGIETFQDLWHQWDHNCADLKGLDLDGFSQQLHHITSSWPLDLPCGLIHGDLFPDNALFDGGKLSGVLDFYFACHDFWLYDLSICLNAWCFDKDNQWHEPCAQALLKGYQSQRQLTCQEWEHFHTVAQGAGFSFFLSRLNNWNRVDNGALVVKKDPKEYAEKLKFYLHHPHCFDVLNN